MVGKRALSLVTKVGRRIGELREARKLTQEEFADLMNVSVKYVQSIEHGRANLTLESIDKIARILREKPQALLVDPTTHRRTAGRPPKS